VKGKTEGQNYRKQNNMKEIKAKERCKSRIKERKRQKETKKRRQNMNKKGRERESNNEEAMTKWDKQRRYKRKKDEE
jgi:hypothetical protein